MSEVITHETAVQMNTYIFERSGERPLCAKSGHTMHLRKRGEWGAVDSSRTRRSGMKPASGTHSLLIATFCAASLLATRKLPV